VAELRQRAARRCLLRPATTVSTIDDSDGTYAALLRQPVVGEPGLAPVPVDALTPVRDVLLAHNRTRYVRVHMVRPTGTVGGTVRYAILPVVLREAALVEAAVRWLRRWRRASKTEDVYPCLCAAHFGLVQSGAALLYDMSWRAHDPAAAPRLPWRVLWHVRVVNNITLTANFGGSWFEYPEYTLHFPMDVDDRYNVTDVEHAEITDVQYTELAQALDCGTTCDRRVVQAGEPYWLATDTGAPPEPASLHGDYVAVLPLSKVAPLPHGQRFEGRAHSCLQHCLAMDQVVAARLRDAHVPLRLADHAPDVEPE
jgi:hypothetical protein